MGLTPVEVPLAAAHPALEFLRPEAPRAQRLTATVALQSGSHTVLDSASARLGHRYYAPHLTPEQLIAAAPKRKQAFDLDALTRAGTASRATNEARPYSARSLDFHAPAKIGPHELIDAIDRVDLRPLKHAGIKPTACFDFDNTLAAGDIFFDFCDLLLARASLPQHNAKQLRELLVLASNGTVRKSDLIGKSTDAIMTRAIRMARAGQLDGSSIFFMLVGALRGMHEYEVNAIAEELFEKGAPGKPPYKNNFFTKDGVGSVDICKALEAKGIEPHIITLGIPVVARIGARYLGIDPKNVHGSELEVQNGKFTGRALDAAVLGKHQIADHYVSRTPLFCFGDTLGSDGPLLSRATAGAFVVDPRDDFHAHIAKNNADIRCLTFR